MNVFRPPKLLRRNRALLRLISGTSGAERAADKHRPPWAATIAQTGDEGLTTHATTRGKLVILNWRDLQHSQAGGAEVVCEKLAANYARRGLDVVLLCAGVSGRPRSERVNGYTVQRRGGKFSVYFWALLWLLVHRRAIVGVIDSQNGIPFFSPLVLRRATPIVMLLHHIHQNQFDLYFPPWLARVGRWMESTGCRIVYRQRAIVAVSPSTRQGAREALRLRGPIRVAPPGIAVSPPPAASETIRSTYPSIVTVGRLVPHKHTELVLRALPRLRGRFPGIQLRVIGGGPHLDLLRQEAVALGVQDAVTFYPNCSNELRDSVVASSWLCVNASMGEGWGISVIEANALGTPVLAFDRPGLRDSIRHGRTGWLLSETTSLVDGVTAALEELSSPAMVKVKADAARAWARRFSWESMAEKVLDTLASEQRRRTGGGRVNGLDSDVATIVTIPLGLVPDGWKPGLGDSYSMCVEQGNLVVFLEGIDTAGTAASLRKMGLPEHVLGADASVRVARPEDHLMYFGSNTRSSGD